VSGTLTMTRRGRPGWWGRLIAVGSAWTVLTSGCTGGDEPGRRDSNRTADAPAVAAEGDDETTSLEDVDLQGEVVTILGPEVDEELATFQATFRPFEERTGVRVEVSGDRSAEGLIGGLVDQGAPPDIFMFPQPGKIAEFVDDIVPLTGDVVAQVEANIDPGWTSFVNIDDAVRAVPVKADVKSLIWYSPTRFAANGYSVPSTFEDFLALTDEMMARGQVPFCAGLGSDAATGWPMTDWIEDFLLRLKGHEIYDLWVAHYIPFDHPDVVEVAKFVVDLWSRDGFVLGGMGSVADVPFADAGLPLLAGDCMMHRQSNFYASNFEAAGASIGPGGDVDVFHLPGTTDHPNITLTGGIYATAFDDRPAVMATMAYLVSAEFADTRATLTGGDFLTPNQNVDMTLYGGSQQVFATILANAEPVRFDASDLMPGAVGADSFWKAAVNITRGADVASEFAAVEAAWPDD
jgi:alpha-glucoside transport system substrate-binding protein